MSKKTLSFLIFGSIPPPYGGVTISVKNLIKALNYTNNNVQFISKKTLFKFKSFDIVHIHYSKKWKVLIAIFIGKLLAKKVIITKHGANLYPKTKLLDKLILTYTDGLIVLNNDVYERCCSKNELIKLPPIFKEGIDTEDIKQQTYIKKVTGLKYLLVYAGKKAFIEGKEVYGIHFLLECLEKLNNTIQLVIIDPTAAYTQEIKQLDNTQITYINKYIDFKSLIKDMDLYIRPTSSDGNSIATLEALSVGTDVLASDVVERAEGVYTYKLYDTDDFINKIDTLLKKEKKKKSDFQAISIQEYLNFCENILKESK